MIGMKNTSSANVTTIFKLSDFGVDKYAPKLADGVYIAIQTEAIKD